MIQKSSILQRAISKQECKVDWLTNGLRTMGSFLEKIKLDAHSKLYTTINSKGIKNLHIKKK